MNNEYLLCRRWKSPKLAGQSLLYPSIVLYIQGFDFGEEVVTGEQGEVAQVGMREAVEVVDDRLDKFLARVGVSVFAAFTDEQEVVGRPIELVAVEMMEFVALRTRAVPDFVHGVMAEDAALTRFFFKICQSRILATTNTFSPRFLPIWFDLS